MNSKVILFSVLLFCSKFVDSIPHSGDLVSQRAYPLSEWKVNQNAQNEEYFDTDFIRTQNEDRLRNQNVQNAYENQGRFNFDSNGYDENPISSKSETELLVNIDSTTDEHRLDSYPFGLESYASRISQVSSDSHQYRNQNWRSLNQYVNSAPSSVPIPGSGRPLVTVQEPYRGPVQYLQSKYIPSTNRRYYQAGRLVWFPRKEQYQYPLAYDSGHKKPAAIFVTKARSTRRNVQRFAPQSGIIYNDVPGVITAGNKNGDNKYFVNLLPRYGPSGSVLFDNYGEEQAASSEIKARAIGSRRYVQNLAPQSEIIYDETPAVIAKDIDNYRTRLDLSKTAPITSYDDGPSVISLKVNNKNVAPADASKYLSEKPLLHRYATNYRSDSGWSNNASDDSDKVAPTVIIENVEVQSGKNEFNYDSDYGLKEHFKAPPVRADKEVLHFANNKYEDSNEPQYGPNSPTPLYINPSPNVYHLSSGIKEYNLQGNRNILAATKKRFVVVVHPNGTVEYVDRHDLNSYQNSKIRLVAGDGILAAQSPAVHNNVEPLPVYTKQRADDNISKLLPSFVNEPDKDENSKPLPQNVNQPTDDVNSKTLPRHLRHLKLKPKHSYINQPGDSNNSKLLPTYTNFRGDDNDMKSLPPYKSQPVLPNKSELKHIYKNQSEGNDNLKPKPSYGNQPGDDDSLEHPLYENQAGDDNNSDPLPPYTNEPTNDSKLKQSHDVPADDTNLYPLPLYVNQQENGEKSKPLDENQSEGDNNSEPLMPYVNQPTYHNKLKSSHQPADDDNPKPLPLYVSQLTHVYVSQPANINEKSLLEDDNNYVPLLPYVNQPTHNNKSKHSHQPADDDDLKPLPLYVNQPTHDKKSRNSYVILPKQEVNLEFSYENQTSDDTNPEPLPLYVSQSANDEEKPFLSDENQPEDNNSKPLQTYQNQPAQDKHKLTSESSSESQPTGDDNFKPLPSYENQSEDVNNSVPLLPYVNQPTYDNNLKPKHAHDVPADDGNSKPLPLYVSQLGNEEKSKHFDENQPEDENDSKPLRTFENPLVYDKTKESKHSVYENQSADDDYSKLMLSDEDYDEATQLHPYEYHPVDDFNSKSTTPVASITDGSSTFTKLTPTVPDYVTLPIPLVTKSNKNRHIYRKSITNPSDVTDVTTAPCQDDTLEDQNLTLSPVEQTCDKESDILPETTMTKRPVKISDKVDIIEDAINEQNEAQTNSSSEDIASILDKVLKYSSTTISRSNPASPVDNISDEETVTEVVTFMNNQTNGETDVNQVNNKTNGTQTDDVDSDEKTVSVSIDTKNDSDDISKASKEEDSKKEHINNDGRDLAKRDPTMWVRTTDKDILDKLIDKDVDLIYLFEIKNEPIIEREKETTKFCNGTVLTETKEITYPHRDDSTPMILKAT